MITLSPIVPFRGRDEVKRSGTIRADRSAMKLAAKFARRETEEARLARIGRRRVASDRADAIRRMLEIFGSSPAQTESPAADGRLVCQDCDRSFALPMHLGRHRASKHRAA